MLGPLTPGQQEEFNKNPRFIGLKFPDISKPETLTRKYIGKMSRDALNLLNGMLALDPEERLSAIDCLAHSYFDQLREPEVDQIITAYRTQKELALRQQHE